MKFTCDVKAMKKHLGRVKDVIDPKATMPILLCVLLEPQKGGGKKGADTVRLTGTDLTTSIRTHVEAAKVTDPTPVAVRLKDLLSALKGIKSGAVTIESSRKHDVKVSVAGGSTVEILGVDPAEVPQIRDGGPCVRIDAAVWQSLVEKTIYAVSKDMTRYILNGLFVEWRPKEGKVKTVGTDGHRIAVATASGIKTWTTSGIVPAKAAWLTAKIAKEVAADDERVSVGISPPAAGDKIVTPGLFTFHGGDAILTALTIEGMFPEYGQVIPRPKDAEWSGKVEVMPFVQTVLQVSEIAIDKARAVKLTANGDIGMIANDPDKGSSSGSVPVEEPKGEKIEVGFNGGYLADAAMASGAPSIRIVITDTEAPMLMKAVGASVDYVAAIMPMRM